MNLNKKTFLHHHSNLLDIPFECVCVCARYKVEEQVALKAKADFEKGLSYLFIVLWANTSWSHFFSCYSPLVSPHGQYHIKTCTLASVLNSQPVALVLLIKNTTKTLMMCIFIQFFFVSSKKQYSFSSAYIAIRTTFFVDALFRADR